MSTEVFLTKFLRWLRAYRDRRVIKKFGLIGPGIPTTIAQRVLESNKVNPDNFHGRIITDKDEINKKIDDDMERRPEIKALRESLKIPR